MPAGSCWTAHDSQSVQRTGVPAAVGPIHLQVLCADQLQAALAAVQRYGLRLRGYDQEDSGCAAKRQQQCRHV
jgi:hypothetical protein